MPLSGRNYGMRGGGSRDDDNTTTIFPVGGRSKSSPASARRTKNMSKKMIRVTYTTAVTDDNMARTMVQNENPLLQAAPLADIDTGMSRLKIKPLLVPARGGLYYHFSGHVSSSGGGGGGQVSENLNGNQVAAGGGVRGGPGTNKTGA